MNREEVRIWKRVDKDLQVRMEVRLVAQEVALQIMIYNLRSHLYSPKALNQLAWQIINILISMVSIKKVTDNYQLPT